MNFLVDAHLPRRLTYRLRDAGHDEIHTLDLPKKNRTTDEEICEISAREARVVITKDADFVNSFFATHKPRKFLLISTGNITNTELEALFVAQIEVIADGFKECNFIELTRFFAVFHM